MSAARARLESHASVSARFRSRGELNGIEVSAAGTYLQGPPTSGTLRWDLKLQVGAQTMALQQIADGRFLWMRRNWSGQTDIDRIDLARIPQEVPRQLPATSWSLGSAGALPELLRNLDRAFDFSAVLPARLEQRDVWALRGDWKRASLARLLPDQRVAIEAGETVDTASLPEHAPDYVVLFLQRDLFPCRIEYRSTKAAGAASAAVADTSMLVLEWVDVTYDAPIDPVMFTFVPGNVPYKDRTAEYLDNVFNWP